MTLDVPLIRSGTSGRFLDRRRHRRRPRRRVWFENWERFVSGHIGLGVAAEQFPRIFRLTGSARLSYLLTIGYRS